MVTDMLGVRHRLVYRDTLLMCQEQLRIEDLVLCMVRVYDAFLLRKYEQSLWINTEDVDPDDYFVRINVEALRDARRKIRYYLELRDEEGVVDKDFVATSDRVIVVGEDNLELKGARKKVWRNHMVKVGWVVRLGSYIAFGYKDDGIGSAQVLDDK